MNGTGRRDTVIKLPPRCISDATKEFRLEKVNQCHDCLPRIDGAPVPKVIDFGVAKALNARLTDKTIYTEHLQIVGTLTSPQLAVDEAGVLITGGAAVATGGLSLLARGIWDRLSRSRNACAQVSEHALKEFEGRLPDLVIE